MSTSVTLESIYDNEKFNRQGAKCAKVFTDGQAGGSGCQRRHSVNKQGSKENPNGGIEWTHIFGPGSGFTANPVRGCEHRCMWKMPDGKITICYAKSTAQVFRKAYPKGFEDVSWHPAALENIRAHKKPAGIFIDSMSDLFGQGVPLMNIREVMQTIFDCPQHVFFSLTKNPGRMASFCREDSFGKILEDWPLNWLVGISVPPTFMFGKELSLDQQKAWLKRALEFLRDCPAQKRWISIEPLSFDVSEIIGRCDTHLDWAVIGAATNGAQSFQPTETNLVNCLRVLNARNIPVFFKGNLDRRFLAALKIPWREEFPKLNAELSDGGERKHERRKRLQQSTRRVDTNGAAVRSSDWLCRSRAKSSRG